MTDPLEKTRAAWAKRQALLEPLTPDQRTAVQELYLKSPWSLEECVHQVTRQVPGLDFTQLSPEGLDRLLEAIRNAPTDPPEPVWWLKPAAWVYGKVCDAYATMLLRSPALTPTELRDLHGLADEELGPKTALRAQRLILREIERRARKEY